ncbi:MAG: ribbon-helix-helix domain-containing protein [Candidatus Diapherotrites archaeon]
MEKLKETILTIRIDKELLKELDFYSDKRKSTRAEFIRQAIINFISDLEDAEDDEYINHFVNGRIDEKEYLKHFGFNKVPNDILELRKQNLSKFKNKEVK